MKRPHIGLCALVGFIGGFAAVGWADSAGPVPAPEPAAPSAAPSEAKPGPASAAPEEDNRLEISAALDPPQAAVRVGEPVNLRITLKNKTSAPLMVPDWEQFAGVVTVDANITDYPGASGRWGFFAIGESDVFQKGDFRPLPPGETVINRTLTLMLPGKAGIGVIFQNQADTYKSLTDGKTQQIKNAWTGRASADLQVEAPAAMSAEMIKRYADIREQLADKIVPAEQKGRLLAQVAEEKHYFAARFLREVAETQPPGPLRDAAVWQLVKLMKVGTAYEAIPMLLGYMAVAKNDLAIRVAILDWAAEALAQEGRLSIANQAKYTWPDALRKDARDKIKGLTEDRNPYLGARAKEALKRLEAAPAP
jgi:hypothetical protein